MKFLDFDHCTALNTVKYLGGGGNGIPSLKLQGFSLIFFVALKFCSLHLGH